MNYNKLAYNSIINRLCITKTSEDKFDLTLKPKVIILGMFPSFYHLEVTTKNGEHYSVTDYSNILLYAIFGFMFSLMIIMSWAKNTFFALEILVFIVLVVLFKIYGYNQLRKIRKEFMI